MNTFNRIVLIVLCVLLVVAAVSIIALTWTIPNRSVNWLADAAQWVDDNDGELEKTLLTTVSAFIGLVATIVLLIELVPRRGPSVRVKDLASGSATLSAAAIGQRIEEAIVQVPHVAEVRANVKSKRKGVIVSLDLQVDPEANLATVTDEACQTATEVLTERVHVTLLRPPTARLHYRELRLNPGGVAATRRATRTAPTPPPAPVEDPPEEAVETPEAPAPAPAVALAGPPELPQWTRQRNRPEPITPKQPDEEKPTEA